jgi:hypothetical protein
MKSLADLKSSGDINLPQNRIVFTGPPSGLSAYLQMENTSNDHISIDEVPLSQSNAKKNGLSITGSVRINATMTPGQKLGVAAKVILNQRLSPGSYEMEATIGGIGKTVLLEVQPFIRTEIDPSEVHFSGCTPGTAHRAHILCTNLGNIPLEIPDGSCLEEDYGDTLARAFGPTLLEPLRNNKADFMESLAESLKRELALKIKISIEESGSTIAPGETLPLNFVFTLPTIIDNKYQYCGELHLFDELLSYRIIRAIGEKSGKKVAAAPLPSKTEKE